MRRDLVNYQNLVRRVDEQCREIEKMYREHISCKKGCADCCRHISIFSVEALAITDGMARLPANQVCHLKEMARDASPDGPCPLLENGICLSYDTRPIICRTHGLPIMIVRQGKPEVDFCPLNFTHVTTLSGKAMIDLDRLNNTLAAINALFAERSGNLPERLTIAEAILSAGS